MLDWLGIRYLIMYIYISIMLVVLCSGIPLTKIHNVISANGTVVDDDIYHFIIITLHMDISFSYLPQAHRATAFHFGESTRDKDKKRVSTL